ncbi:MAG: Crp/Fnr family transcriptional regulator [Fibrobacter sp.]|nr:Crp/Fnr family transcriptional regulator [Fibrobacter sp.]
MITGDSRQQVIPPTRSRVKAGFVVYSPDSGERNIIILDEGELAAIDRNNGIKTTVFKMHPGDLVGVAALLEHENFRYAIEATEDSTITVVTEECMESELKTLPVWMLAVIRSLSSKTRKLKDALHHTRCENTLKSLAEYCSHLEAKKKYPLKDLVHEFHWLTRIPSSVVNEEIKALARRKFLVQEGTGEDTTVYVVNTLLLQIFVDYQNATEHGVNWEPFTLSLAQKRLLVKISSVDQSTSMDAPAWIAFFKEAKLQIDVTEWIRMQQFGWFKPGRGNTFTPNTDKIKYYLAALRYETNIRGVL